MADVVQERGDLDVERGARRQLAPEPADDTLCDMKRTERVPEPRVLGARIHQPREPHLLDPAQALQDARVEQVRDRSIGALELDESMHRIPEHAVFHTGILPPVRGDGVSLGVARQPPWRSRAKMPW
jgi:hypothetical protein